MKLTFHRLLSSAALCAVLSFSSSAYADTTLSKSALSEKFQELVPFQIVEVNDHESGMYEIVVDRGIFYATKDGEHLFTGAVHQLKTGLPNLTEQKKAQVAARIIGHLEPTFVTYPAVNEKHEVLVFFDSSCGYCHKLHRELAQYNDMGITVHYALYPRSGTTFNGQPTQEYTNLSAVSCAANKELAMNTLVSGQTLRPSNCESQVQNHYQLGQWLGVAGTPAIFNMDGNPVAKGYMPARQLIQTLGAS